MKTSPHIQSKQALEEFDKKIKFLLISDDVNYDNNNFDFSRIESFITSSHISLLQSVVELVREMPQCRRTGQIIKKIEDEIKNI